MIVPSHRSEQHTLRELVETHEALFNIHNLGSYRISYLPMDFPIVLPDRDECYAAHLRASRKVTSMSNTTSRVRRPSAVMFGGHHRS